MELCEIKVEIDPAHVETTDNALLELGVAGWSVVEDIIIKRAWVVGIFADQNEAASQWGILSSELEHLRSLTPSYRKLADQDWKDSYKAHFKASQFGKLHWVPVWEKATHPLPEGSVALWLDPGLAFGTGNHETTRLCAERLVTLASEQGGHVSSDTRVIDAGCGSGILALSAALLGYQQIQAFDNDPEAVRISEENAALNGLSGAVYFYEGDLTTGLSRDLGDIVIANIQADVLMRFATELVHSVRPGGTLILSGILAHENDQVRQAFAAQAPGWTLQHRVMGEWSDVVLTRPRKD